jgi:branched-chain amino acid transport system permease protein
MMHWIDALLQGVLLGGLYALFAMGQSLIFGVMRLTNVAHGDFIILAAFGALVAAGGSQLNPFLVMLLLAPIAFGVGYAAQRGILNGTLGRDPLPSLVVTFGLSIVIQNLLLEIFSADTRSISALGLETKAKVSPLACCRSSFSSSPSSPPPACNGYSTAPRLGARFAPPPTTKTSPS